MRIASMKPSSIVPVDELYELGHMLCKLSTDCGGSASGH